jgi:hypothetical protein
VFHVCQPRSRCARPECLVAATRVAALIHGEQPPTPDGDAIIEVDR